MTSPPPAPVQAAVKVTVHGRVRVVASVLKEAVKASGSSSKQPMSTASPMTRARPSRSAVPTARPDETPASTSGESAAGR